MRIAYITAGAAGMFCGSCMHDNTLVSRLIALGHEALLVPTYTPIRTDEKDVSQRRVFLGGINVYLQQKFGLFRHTPWFFDRLLDVPSLLRWVSRYAVKTEAQVLGELTLSVLQGEHGHQQKELTKLADWLADDVKPQIVNLTNVLLSGLARQIKQRTGAPLLATLQGDDIFLESLPEPYRRRSMELIRSNCADVDGYIATSAYYADFMADYLGLPRDRIHVIYPGLDLTGYGDHSREIHNAVPVIGFFARICPEKGLHLLAEAFRILRQERKLPCKLRVSGWLGDNNRDFFAQQRRKIDSWGLAEDFEYFESPDHVSKVRFLQGIDVLSVPTTYREPKGLYVLEALANGVPVVQPRHGSFPELIERTGGGLLVNPDDPADLAGGLQSLLEDREFREAMGRKGQLAVWKLFHADRMAQETVDVYTGYVPSQHVRSASLGCGTAS
jgi:glycosyltransferase involved in cell wall biosynthesis